MDAALRLSEALGAAGKPVQDSLLNDRSAPTAFTMTSSIITQTRPHTIYPLNRISQAA